MLQLRTLHRTLAAIDCPPVLQTDLALHQIPAAQLDQSARSSRRPWQTRRYLDHTLCCLPSGHLAPQTLTESRRCLRQLIEGQKRMKRRNHEPHTAQLTSLLRGRDCLGLYRLISVPNGQFREPSSEIDRTETLTVCSRLPEPCP